MTQMLSTLYQTINLSQNWKILKPRKGKALNFSLNIKLLNLKTSIKTVRMSRMKYYTGLFVIIFKHVHL